MNKQKVVLIFFLFISSLFLLSCSAQLLNNQKTIVSIALSIPENLKSDIPQNIRAEIASNFKIDAVKPSSSRYISNLAKSVITTITINGKSLNPETHTLGEKIEYKLAVNTECTIAIDLLDTTGIIGRGVSKLFTVQAGDNDIKVSIAPLQSESMTAGSTDIEFTNTTPNTKVVYKIPINKNGEYSARLLNGGEMPTQGLSLYEEDGTPFAMTWVNNNFDSYYLASIKKPGNYFLVAEFTSETYYRVNFDSDLHPILNANGIYINETLSIMDRQRPFTITIPSGIVANSIQDISYGLTLGDGTIETVLSNEGKTITFTPTTDTVLPSSPINIAITFTFTDALLGEVRSININNIPAPRAVRYVSPSGDDGEDGLWGGGPFATLQAAYSAISYLSEAAPPVIAIQEGNLKNETTIFDIAKPVFVVGGCNSSWTKTDNSKKSTVNLYTDSAFGINIIYGAADSKFIDIDFASGVITKGDPSTTFSLVSTTVNVVFSNCIIRNDGFEIGGGNVELFFIPSGNPIVELNHCKILGGNIRYTQDSTENLNVAGIQSASTNTSTILLISTLVHPGYISTTLGDKTLNITGINFSGNTGKLYVINSTISSGFSDSGTSTSEYAVCAPGDLFYSTNSLFFTCDSDAQERSTFKWDNTIPINELVNNYRNNYLAFTNPALAYINKTGIGAEQTALQWNSFGNNNNSGYLSTVAFPLTFNKNVSPLNLDLHPNNSTSPIIREGALDLSTYENQTLLLPESLISQELVQSFLYDLDGKLRTVPFSIGAYEVD